MSQLQNYSMIVAPAQIAVPQIFTMSLTVRYMCQGQSTAAISGPTGSIINCHYRALRCVQQRNQGAGEQHGNVFGGQLVVYLSYVT